MRSNLTCSSSPDSYKTVPGGVDGDVQFLFNGKQNKEFKPKRRQAIQDILLIITNNKRNDQINQLKPKDGQNRSIRT